MHPFIFYSIADDVNVGAQTTLIKKEEISQKWGATETISNPSSKFIDNIQHAYSKMQICRPFFSCIPDKVFCDFHQC